MNGLSYKTSGRWVVVCLLLFAGLLALIARVQGPRIVLRPASVAPLRLALLPFRNAAGDPELEGPSSEFRRALEAALRQEASSRVDVLPETAVRFYRPASPSPERLGRLLRADLILEGAITANGGGRLVVLQLVRVSDRNRLWAARYRWHTETSADTLAREIAPRVLASLS